MLKPLVSAGVLAAVAAAQGVTWEWRSVRRFPPAGQSMAAYDELRGRGVLFGGTTTVDETWEWDGSAWRYRHQVSPPPPRYWGAMAWDPAQQRVLMFGGFTSIAAPYGMLDDTWSWTGSAWQQHQTPVAPPRRVRHSMATDPVRQRVVLFGGTLGGWPGYTDTWEWDGAQWAQIQPATRSPQSAADSPMAWNSITQRVSLHRLAYGGWSVVEEWDGVDWVQTPGVGGPQSFGGGAVAVADPLLSGVRVQHWGDGPSYAPTQYLWDGQQYQPLPSSGGPPIAWAGFADTARGELALTPGPGWQTWTQDLATSAWAPRTYPQGTPGGDWRTVHLPWRDAFAVPGPVAGSGRELWLRNDEGFERFGLLPTTGGRLFANPGTRELFWIDPQQNYWRRQGAGFVLTSIATPGGLPATELAYDPRDHGVWCSIQNSLYEWSGTTFTYVDTPPFHLHQAAVDPDRDVLAVLGWNPWMLHEWDGAAWTSHALPATVPPPSPVFVPGRGLLFVNATTVWRWDGTSWSGSPIQAPAGAPTSVSCAHDPVRDRLVSGLWDLHARELSSAPAEPQPGSTIVFDVGSPPHAHQPWVLLFAWGTWPSIPLGALHPAPLRALPLSPDELLISSLGRGLTGFLDHQGRAQVSWPLPADPGLAGLRLFACAVSLTAALSAGLVSNPVEIYVLP